MPWLIRRIKDGWFWRRPDDWYTGDSKHWQLTTYVKNPLLATHYDDEGLARIEQSKEFEELVTLDQVLWLEHERYAKVLKAHYRKIVSEGEPQ